MKKKLILLVAVVLVFSMLLVGCGDNDTEKNNNNNNQPTDQSDVLPEDLISDGLTKKQKDEIQRQASEDGADVNFNPDGSTEVTYEDGSVAKQNSDGTWDYVDADGNKAQLGGDWPSNEYTKLIPKPEFGTLVYAGSDDSNSFAASFSNVTVEDVKAYVTKVKNNGFTLEPSVTDSTAGGMVVYAYIAKNSSGYGVNVSFANGSFAVSIEK